MIARLVAAFDRLWFSPVPAARLAWVRVLVGVFAIHHLYDERAGMIHTAGASAAVFHPVGIVALHASPVSPVTFERLHTLSMVLAVLFTLGLWHRVVGPVFALLVLWITTYASSWAMVFHTENMFALHVGILGLAASSSAVSVDAALTARRPGLARWGFAARATGDHHRFAWPLRCLQLGATLPYVVAGLAKVQGELGWRWALGYNLRDQITMNGLYYEVLRGGAKTITHHVYEPRFTVLFAFSATMTLVIELLAPLALLHRRVGYLFVVGVMSMHWSILWLMGIPFPYQLYGFAFASFFALDELAGRVARVWARLRGRGATEDDAGSNDAKSHDAKQADDGSDDGADDAGTGDTPASERRAADDQAGAIW